MTLPTLTVLLDDGAGNFPYDISSKVLFTDGYSYNRGRADWQGGVTAGTLSLTLNNSDGRFTPGSTIINATSPIRVDQRIRVKQTINGTTFTAFTGYVKSWPIAWPATVGTFAVANITAVDAQARAERLTMGVGIAEEILATAPTDYWPLTDPAAATVGVNVAESARPISQAGTGTAVVFGSTSAPGTADSTAATFAAGKWLSATGGVGISTTPGYALAFATSSVSVSLMSPSSTAVDLYVAGTGRLVLGATTVSVDPVNDGLPHFVTIRYTSTSTADVYLDGVQTGTSVGVDVGGYPLIGAVTVASATGFVGNLAHAAFWNTAPTAAQMLAISSGGADRVAETTSARVSRLAGYADIPTGSLDAGLTTVPAQDALGVSAWDAAQAAVDAEVGVAFVDESGNVEFHNRNRVPLKTTPDLTLVANLHVTPDVQPVDDDQQILNYVEATSSVTGATQVVRNTLSELGDGTATNPGHGRYTDSKTYIVSTDAEALDRANWIVTNFAEPTTRYGTLTINLFAMTPAMAATVLTALDVDCWLRVTQMASQNTTGTTANVVVQGYTVQATANSWTATCNVVSRSLYNALILDDATYGVLDSSVARLAV